MTLRRPRMDGEFQGPTSDTLLADARARSSVMSCNVSPTLSARRLWPFLLLAGAGALFICFGGRSYLTFAVLAESSEWMRGLAGHSSIVAPLCFIAIYAGLTAMSVPGGAMLTIAGGLLFGTWPGLLYAVFGATIGATMIFMAARAGLGDLAVRAGPRADRIKAGLRADAFNYLLVLRLIPLFPFWLVNLAAAVVGMRLGPYVFGTFVGIIPGGFIFVSLGSGMGDIVAAGRPPDLGIIFRPSVLLPILGLAVLAVIPVLYRHWRTRAARDQYD